MKEAEQNSQEHLKKGLQEKAKFYIWYELKHHKELTEIEYKKIFKQLLNSFSNFFEKDEIELIFYGEWEKIRQREAERK